MAENSKILFECQSINSTAGTGVATYARNLVTEAKAAGYSVAGVFDVEAKLRSKSAALTEVEFFDATKKKKGRFRNLSKAWRILHRDPFGVSPRTVARTGMVVGQSMGAFDKIFDGFEGVQHLNERAAGHFMRFGNLLALENTSRARLLHTTHATPMRLRGAPTICTIHDIIPLRLPYATLDNKRYFYNLIRSLTQKLDHIVTVSEHSKRDLIEFFGVPESRITNTYQAVYFSEKERQLSDDAVAVDLERSQKLEFGNYFLFVGAVEPKKNISALIDAYVASGTTRPLVLAGGLGWQYEQDVRQIRNERFVSFKFQGEEFRRERSVRHLNYVPRSTLISLIRGARALAFPSLYEGFGLPVLEAMTLGTPVISSNSSSLPEICGDAAMMVNPYDVASIANAIRTLDKDDDLCRELVAKGKIQAGKFSPENYRAALAKLYKTLI